MFWGVELGRVKGGEKKVWIKRVKGSLFFDFLSWEN